MPRYLIRLTNHPTQKDKELPDEVVTDLEAVEIGRHLQIMLHGEWARGGRKGKVPEVEVVRVLWRGEGSKEQVKVMAKGQGT